MRACGKCIVEIAALYASASAWLLPSTGLAQFRPKDTEWPSYAADLAGSRYRPLDQINASNFNDLEIAWRIKTDNFGDRPEYKLEGTPLMVNGVLYATAGSRRAVIALDPATGELLWIHGEHEGKRGGAAPRQLSGRGLAYWSDGKEERILYVTPGFRLICLDAKTGVRIPSFGNGGEVDLKLNDDQDILPDLITGEIGIQSAPVVAKDTVIIGAAFREGMTPRSMRNNKGLCARLRRSNRQTSLDFPHHSEEGRVRLRHLGERLRGIHRQHRRVDADHCG